MRVLELTKNCQRLRIIAMSLGPIGLIALLVGIGQTEQGKTAQKAIIALLTQVAKGLKTVARCAPVAAATMDGAQGIPGNGLISLNIRRVKGRVWRLRRS